MICGCLCAPLYLALPLRLGPFLQSRQLVIRCSQNLRSQLAMEWEYEKLVDWWYRFDLADTRLEKLIKNRCGCCKQCGEGREIVTLLVLYSTKQLSCGCCSVYLRIYYIISTVCVLNGWVIWVEIIWHSLVIDYSEVHIFMACNAVPASNLIAILSFQQKWYIVNNWVYNSYNMV